MRLQTQNQGHNLRAWKGTLARFTIQFEATMLKIFDTLLVYARFASSSTLTAQLSMPQPRYEIEMQNVTDAFAVCWRAAGNHLNAQTQDGIQYWLRAQLMPPFLEHLSFRLGNQLFFVRIGDASGELEMPGTTKGLELIAESCNGHACLLPMKKKAFSGDWEAVNAGWGLIDVRTRKPLDPLNLITDDKVAMTDWELQDFAVQIVRQKLESDGYELMSFQGNPSVNPSIWFVGESKSPEWVVVRAFRDPVEEPKKPDTWNAIAESCAKLSRLGHFAPVFLFNAQDFLNVRKDKPLPLWRGHSVTAEYRGFYD